MGSLVRKVLLLSARAGKGLVNWLFRICSAVHPELDIGESHIWLRWPIWNHGTHPNHSVILPPSVYSLSVLLRQLQTKHFHTPFPQVKSWPMCSSISKLNSTCTMILTYVVTSVRYGCHLINTQGALLNSFYTVSLPDPFQYRLIYCKQ